MHNSTQCRLATPDGGIDYILTRSLKRRRTMEIRIDPSGTVQVSAPHSFSIKAVEGFLAQKARWIVGKSKMFREREVLTAQQNLGCLYLGQYFPVRCAVSQEQWGRVIFDDQGWEIRIAPSVEPGQREQYSIDFLQKWFLGRAKIVLNERVAHYARLMDEDPAEVRIRSPKRLWGSCHPTKRVLHFNWKIVMAPLEVLDYVVVHELSHIKVPNHSQRFWQRVGQFAPAYKSHRDWLRKNSYRFMLSLGQV